MTTEGPLVPRRHSRGRRLLHLAAGVGIVAGLVASPGAGFPTGLGRDSDRDLKLLGRGTGKTPALPNFARMRGKPIRLLVGAFDPQSGRSPAQRGIALRNENTLPSGVAQYWLVQARDKRFADVARAVHHAGATLAGFVPDDAYMVRATPAQ